MKILANISDDSLGLSVKKGGETRIRNSVRAILFNDKDEVSYQFATKNNYYKLPGGGIKNGETIEVALKREVLEETGCDISVGDFVGVVVERRGEYNVLQISYCYVAKFLDCNSGPSYDDLEIREGLTPCWGKLDDFVELLKSCEPKNYVGKFIVARDLVFVLNFLKNNKNKNF